jgi:hypothetical protein
MFELGLELAAELKGREEDKRLMRRDFIGGRCSRAKTVCWGGERCGAAGMSTRGASGVLQPDDFSHQSRYGFARRMGDAFAHWPLQNH